VDLGLIDAARSGNRVAQATLLRELQDQWYRVLLRLLGNADAAREATQETALRFLRQLPGFQGRSELRTWTLGIAMNVAREMRRAKEQDELTIDPPANGHGPDGELEQRERAQMVNRVIDELPDRQKEAVLLRFFEQLSVEQSATVMGCAPGTVKALVFQALRNMRDKVE